ncbi:MAG: 16S rRNA (guanine(527)-N(7))-methyltransferase RsmG [Rhodospirillales bacterium 12-54-5]|nr:MAG: 16S rRNA (guanine(527)-N(7))-methyltransferase RsmG [Rhodospirillales bacterium 12-54-5]
MNELSPDVRNKLEYYVALLSVQLAEHLPAGTKTLVDLGSGAGLPGLILAIALPKIHVTLVERDQRKCAFLIEAVRQLELMNVQIKNSDIALCTGHFDVVTARALASLSELCTLAYPLCGVNSICLFPKGENFASEVVEASVAWDFVLDKLSSKTNSLSVILALSHLKPQH